MKKLFCIGLALVLVGIFAFGAYAADSGLKAVIISLNGDVKIDPQGNGNWSAAEISMELKQGTVLKTGPDSSVDLALDKAMLNMVNVAENTTIAIDRLSDSLSQVGLRNGRVLAKLKGLKNGAVFQVRTPTAVCGARGTGMGVEFAGGITNIEAFENVIYVQGIGANGEVLNVTVEVPAGWKSAVEAGGNPTPPAELTANELQVWDAWVAAVSGTLAATEAANEVTTDENARDISPAK